MTDLERDPLPINAPRDGRSQSALAARLAGIRAEIRAVVSAPYSYGRLNGPHRRRRDELILQGLAADTYARITQAAS
jgi:hypothetical protein